MAQHDYVIANGTGAAVRSDINNGLAAIVSNNSGATEPATMYAYQWWADTTTGLLKIRNAANNGWVTVGTLASANLGLLASAGTLTAALGSASTPGITFTGDTNTGIYSPGADQVAISTNGTGRLFVDANGNVGVKDSTVITTSAVSAPTFQIGDGAGSPALVMYSSTTGASQISFADATTGTASYDGYLLYNQSSQYLAIGTASTERMRLDSSGRLGIGTTTPDQPMTLNAANGYPVMSFQNNGTTVGDIGFNVGLGMVLSGRSTNPILFYTNSSERGRWDSSGRFLVGTSSGAGKLVVQDSSLPKIQSNFNGTAHFELGTGGSGCGFAMTTGLFMTFNHQPYADRGTDNNLTERMRITSSGLVGINTTTKYDSEAVSLAVAGAFPATPVEVQQNGTSTHYAITFRNANGLVGNISTSGSATSFNTSSDYRLKENVIPLTGAAERLNQLQVHRFNFIADPDKTVDGFIAHEAQAIVPECVTGTKDEVDADGNPVYQGIDQSKLVPLLTAALQEALQKIDAMEARLAALEGA